MGNLKRGGAGQPLTLNSFLNFEDADLAAEEEASISVGAIPDNFDVETNWPNCVMPVQDQGHCGSFPVPSDVVLLAHTPHTHRLVLGLRHHRGAGIAQVHCRGASVPLFLFFFSLLTLFFLRRAATTPRSTCSCRRRTLFPAHRRLTRSL